MNIRLFQLLATVLVFQTLATVRVITSCPATCAMNCTPCLNIHTEHSLRQASKGILREASQREYGSGNSSREQRKGRPLQDGSRVLECALNAVPGYFARGM